MMKLSILVLAAIIFMVDGQSFRRGYKPGDLLVVSQDGKLMKVASDTTPARPNFFHGGVIRPPGLRPFPPHLPPPTGHYPSRPVGRPLNLFPIIRPPRLPSFLPSHLPQRDHYPTRPFGPPRKPTSFLPPIVPIKDHYPTRPFGPPRLPSQIVTPYLPPSTPAVGPGGENPRARSLSSYYGSSSGSGSGSGSSSGSESGEESPIAGAQGPARKPDAHILELVELLKYQIRELACRKAKCSSGGGYSKIRVINYKTQIVAGSLFRVKLVVDRYTFFADIYECPWDKILELQEVNGPIYGGPN